jgi:hypothetical protein
MVLGEETGRNTGGYYCGPPDYQPTDEPSALGLLRGLMFPQFKAMRPAPEARDAELGRRLWEMSEVRSDGQCLLRHQTFFEPSFIGKSSVLGLISNFKLFDQLERSNPD